MTDEVEPRLRPTSVQVASRRDAFDWAPFFADTPDAEAKPGAMPWTRSTARLVDGINRRINAALTPATDKEAFGEEDRWALPLSEGLAPRGNCKHYAMEKRRALIAQGVPPEALSLAVARTPWGEVHAVLLLSTSRGDMVLDNLSPWVTPWDETGYTWLQRQRPGRPRDWRAVPVMAAALR